MNALCIWVKEPSRPRINLGYVGPLLKGLLSRINKIPLNRVIPNKKAAAAAKQGVVALQPKKRQFYYIKTKRGVPTSKSLDITSIDDDANANANDTTVDSADSSQLCDDNTTDNSFQQIAFEASLDERSNPEEQPYTSDITDYGCARNTRSRSKI